jgi:imidazolonepropionase-like amidohydrolase
MRTLFRNVRIIDGTGSMPSTGHVLIKGNRIESVLPASAAAVAAERIVEGRGSTLMPGLIESHAHLSFADIAVSTDLGCIPPEEHTLITARHARILLDHGFTSCVSAASAKPRLDIVIRNAIEAGEIPGPRLLAASPELTVTSGLGDARLSHMHRDSFAIVCDGADQLRRVAREMVREGVDTLKINVSGDTLLPPARSAQTVMTPAEVEAVCDVAHRHGLRVAAHTRNRKSIELALRYDVELVYHANFADAEAIELLAARRDRVFVSPTLGATVALLERGERFGRFRDPRARGMVEEELDAGIAAMRALKARGVRVLPGGDYGFAHNPNGENARDLEHFVKLLGFTPLEAITAATSQGGELMRRGHELGQIRDGFLADLLLVDGDPVSDISILQHESRLRAIMKDGVFHKEPQEPTS